MSCALLRGTCLTRRIVDTCAFCRKQAAEAIRLAVRETVLAYRRQVSANRRCRSRKAKPHVKCDLVTSWPACSRPRRVGQ